MKKNLRLEGKRDHHNIGFTLIELLVVIAIISILAMMALVGVPGIIKKAKTTACQNNLRGLYQGLLLYESEFKEYPYGDEFKGSKFWEALRSVPTPDSSILHDKEYKVFICPFTKKKPELGVCSYRGPKDEVSDTTRGNTPLGADMITNHGPEKDSPPINILYIGGAILETKYRSRDWDTADENLE